MILLQKLAEQKALNAHKLGGVQRRPTDKHIIQGWIGLLGYGYPHPSQYSIFPLFSHNLLYTSKFLKLFPHIRASVI